jgi:hypothetical protein
VGSVTIAWLEPGDPWSQQVFLSIRAMSRQHWQALAVMRSLFYRNAMRDAIPWLPVST